MTFELFQIINFEMLCDLKKEELGGFSLKRVVDGKELPKYLFKKDAVIEPHTKIKVPSERQAFYLIS